MAPRWLREETARCEAKEDSTSIHWHIRAWMRRDVGRGMPLYVPPPRPVPSVVADPCDMAGGWCEMSHHVAFLHGEGAYPMCRESCGSCLVTGLRVEPDWDALAERAAEEAWADRVWSAA